MGLFSRYRQAKAPEYVSPYDPDAKGDTYVETEEDVPACPKGTKYPEPVLHDWKPVKEYRWHTLKESAGYKHQRLQQKEIDFSESARYYEANNMRDHIIAPRWVYCKKGHPDATPHYERVVKVDVPDEYTGL